MHLLISKTSLNQICISLPSGATSIGYNFGHQEPTLALVTNLATRWCPLHSLQIWPPGGATCIDYKIGHQVALLALERDITRTWVCSDNLEPDPIGLLGCFSEILSDLDSNPVQSRIDEQWGFTVYWERDRGRRDVDQIQGLDPLADTMFLESLSRKVNYVNAKSCCIVEWVIALTANSY